ncbi:MAG: hypothetical protein A2504_00345 [Bdellovibrionales bacterium RIFOXYD12_FULL_39_22]|nr:MAG: hypothetical protein A2385_13925 [Bdellovibrionales bacterium RIFOXYB1_FULL_39_21]OFZ42430.1 MAG: hypothetical protein A2485_03975 [Bdellovibrionales bacterium RIFOXYC12_FULL_39_17]OFZ45406.1 MAG: hypothetical protein A2404_01415 [Bdellovibrionales bacterium RIFOXYC1_FULL_39_130]OFZ74603.1 MAG: hypothetical protein A2560_09445 [Bdellovibrionales bacterium RIFOXYD1_FULL_39_84]OFZ92885.1 MAG: hypothetical protein A2504_00345 [Bdellovibrionales bacterium RIFOXYD12_FULL_39_22]HLE12830.1 hy
MIAVKNIMLIAFTICVYWSCGFNSEKNNSNNNPEKMIDPVRTDKDEQDGLDSDGDKVLDREEIALGRRPYLADIPKVDVRFLQNYIIEGKFKNLATGADETMLIDTKLGRDNPEFKYRVGELFIRNESYKVAANVGKFSTHSWGEIAPHDLSWVSYPEIDPQFYAQKVLENKHLFDTTKYELSSLSITLESSAKLQGNSGFVCVKNLVVDFYYYNQASESFELLKSAKVERSFNAGVNETFAVKIENVPVDLIAESYFKRGEFVISSVRDYEISELETTFSELLASVKNKSLPVVVNTPLDTRISYVGVNGNSDSFQSILEKIFGDKVRIENDVLEKIDQFANNLPPFTYLQEISSQDKKGQWFVFTNKINQHYLDYKYGTGDVISLSYITGTELANQSSEKIVGVYQNISGDQDYAIYGIGNITPNSQIDIQIAPLRKWGESFVSEDRDYHERPCSCGRNCICGVFTVDCFVKVNHFNSYNNELFFQKDLGQELEQLSLLFNNTEFSLRELVEKRLVNVSWTGKNIHIVISEPSQIIELKNFKENVLFLKLKSVSATTFQGAYMHSVGGKDKKVCPGLVANASRAWGEEGVYSESVMIRDFDAFVRRGLKLLPPRPYSQKFSVSVSSVINNKFN